MQRTVTWKILGKRTDTALTKECVWTVAVAGRLREFVSLDVDISWKKIAVCKFRCWQNTALEFAKRIRNQI